MPLIVTCSKCQTKWALSEDERSVFFKEIKTKEQLESILCPECENPKTKTITIHNVDITLLKLQKEAVIDLRERERYGTRTYDRLSGLLHFLDACTDAAEDTEDACPWCGYPLIKTPRGVLCSTSRCDYKDYI